MHIRDIPLDTSLTLRQETTELSFILCPSPYDGVGVFCTHGIQKGTFLRLFPGPEPRYITNKDMTESALLAVFSRHYGIEAKEGGYVPHDFGYMEIGWYLNHSAAPNTYRDSESRYFASRDIVAGEEITIDYDTIQ
jgi:SET domain-containing protein